MKTTLNIIKSKKPCEPGWNKLLKSLSKTKADDEPVSLEFILKSNGIEDAVWALRCFVIGYEERNLFVTDIINLLPGFHSIKCDNAEDIFSVVNYAVSCPSPFRVNYYFVDSAASPTNITINKIVVDSTDSPNKWEEIKQIFIKRFIKKED